MTGGDQVGESGAGGKGERRRRAGKPPRPDLCRRYARKELAAKLPQILECFLEQAEKGSIPHAKALMSMAGLDKEGPLPPLPAKRRQKTEGGLSKLLLEELRRRPSREAAPRDKGPEDTPDQGVVYG